jgi:hypothetical protein
MERVTQRNVKITIDEGGGRGAITTGTTCSGMVGVVPAQMIETNLLETG